MPDTGNEYMRKENLFSTFNITKHALLRMAQRNFSFNDLEYVLEYGERINTTGATVYFLRKRDIPQGDRNKSEITRLEGAVVLTGLAEDGRMEVITTYRNKGAFKELRSKTKYDNRKKYRMNRNLSLAE